MRASGKVKIEIRSLLSEVPDVGDPCIQRLIDMLAAKVGVTNAHIASDSESATSEVCIHFDADRLSISEVREFAKRAGAKLHERYGHMLLSSPKMHIRQARTLGARVRQVAGVLEAEASAEGVLRIEFDREETDEESIQAEVESLGVKTTDEKSSHSHSKDENAENKKHSHSGLLGEQSELIFAILCGLLLVIGWGFSLVAAANPRISWSLYVGAFFFGGFFTLREAINSIRAGRFEIDFLMLVAAAGAASLGEWGEGALLLFLFSLGHALEHYAMGRARRAIEALADLAPDTALVRNNGDVEEVDVDQLKLNDVVVIKPNEKIPADGFVIKGESSVNQAPITGESAPVDKKPVPDLQSAAQSVDRLDSKHRVFAGTINQSGALEVQVTQLSTESTLAKVVKMVNEAETRVSPTQRLTDKFERYFVPAVLGFVFLLLFAWVVLDEPFSASFYRAMTVLVAASPCALAIATPSAVLSGIARAANGGVLIKGGGPLESLGTVKAIAFDKTGTLTEGKPRLTDVVASPEATEEQLLQVAVAVEELSDHPLASAVARDGRERLGDVSLPKANNLQSITGRGVSAEIDNQIVHIGKDDLFSEVAGTPLPEELRQHIEELEANGRTTMIVREGDRYLGVLGLMDTPRESAKAMIKELRELGVTRMIMISGDNQQVANAVAREVGIDEAWGDLMPNDKVESIKKLRQENGVAMVGDGVNDAPAMANATVGIAMGAAGSDVALETADVALMADDLSHLPFAVGLSRQTRRIIRQNLWFSLAMVAILVPAATLGLSMGFAVLFHEGSTILVVVNALRLLTYGRRSLIPT